MSEPAGQRRPTDDDLQPLLEMIWEGTSLRSACKKLELHIPSTSDWLHADETRREQYARAREGRAEYLAEDALAVNRAAALGVLVDGKKVDASGARGYLEATKWQTARMAPKTAPITRIAHSFENLSDAELDAEIARLEASRGSDPESAEGGEAEAATGD